MNEKKDWETIGNQEEAPVDETTSAEPLIDHPSYIELETKLNEAEAKANDSFNQLLQLQAEMANMQRRTERDVAKAHKYALEKFALALLQVIDNLERSLTLEIPADEQLKNFYTGIELTLKLLLDTCQSFGITVIDPLGETFDPTYHTAIKMEPSPAAKPNTVLKVLQKGYLLKDRLLRPAAVIVNQ